jgi:hypothetical protein
VPKNNQFKSKKKIGYHMHMYLIFDQAFGNEQKKKIFPYIVLCCVA